MGDLADDVTKIGDADSYFKLQYPNDRLIKRYYDTIGIIPSRIMRVVGVPAMHRIHVISIMNRITTDVTGTMIYGDH